MANCVVCDGMLKAGQRRSIGNEAKYFLKCLLSESEDESTVERFLKEYEFVCKSKCFLMVENAVKCKQSLKVLEEKVLNTYKTHKLSCRITITAKRRILPDSPIREALTQPIAGDSPTVSVNFLICLFMLTCINIFRLLQGGRKNIGYID
jgi:hypothetical protein